MYIHIYLSYSIVECIVYIFSFATQKRIPIFPARGGVLVPLPAPKDQAVRGRLVLRSLLREYHRAIESCRFDGDRDGWMLQKGISLTISGGLEIG